MTDFSKDTKENLITAAKTHIATKQSKEFKDTLEATYTVTVTKSRDEIEYGGTYDIGTYHKVTTVNYLDEEERDYFGYDEHNVLLAHAVKHNNLEIIEWYMNKGYYLNSNQFKSLCDNPENSDLMEKISDRLLTIMINNNMINNNQVEYTKIILKNSPHLKGNPQLSQRLDAIKPLFSDLSDLKQIETNETKDGNTQAVQTLKDYAKTTHGHIKNFLTGRTAGEAFLTLATRNAESSMAKLEEKSEGLAVFKNIMLCLTVIGPFIKKLDTGQWLYENSTTSKVRETTDKFKGMKESLTLFKEQANTEPKPEPHQEHVSQPR